MALKMVAVTKEEALAVKGPGVRKSAMRDAVKSLADDFAQFFADNPDANSCASEVVYNEDGSPSAIVGFKWMDLSDDLQDACKREKGGGMAAIVSNINRNFKDSHKIRATLQNPGESPESGEIIVYPYTPKTK